jgi:hypothetical protein
MSVNFNKLEYDREAMKILRSIVEIAGGYFIGVQTGFLPLADPGVAELWFTNPSTTHSLRVLYKMGDFIAIELQEAVSRRIADDDAAAAKKSFSVPVTTLKKLSADLLKLSQEVAVLYEEKK